MYAYTNGIIKVSNGNSDTLFIDKDDSIFRLTNLESMKLKCISPDGKYVIMAGSSIPGFIEDDIYLISTLKWDFLLNRQRKLGRLSIHMVL